MNNSIPYLRLRFSCREIFRAAPVWVLALLLLLSGLPAGAQSTIPEPISPGATPTPAPTPRPRLLLGPVGAPTPAPRVPVASPSPAVPYSVNPPGFGKAPWQKPGPPQAGALRLPLRKLIGEQDDMLLKNASAIYTLFVPQSARYELETCNLHLEFTNSIALLSERSVIRVVLNDVIVAQFYLDRNNPFNAADIPIPIQLMETGFNRLQFVIAQHYTYECEDPSAPELYTEISPDASYLEATGTWRAIPERLSYLRWWVDEKLWEPYEFNVCLPTAGQISDLQLAWGALVTQGVALAINNEPFRVETAAALRPGMDNIVIGTMTELSGFLTATEIGSINGSFLAIKSLPGDPAHCMIVVSGRNEQEVGQAALALGLVNYALPDSQFFIVDSLQLTDRPAYIRNAPLSVPGVYSFRQLGFETRSVKGWHTGGYELPVYMPGDISKEDNSNAELRLHFTYGAMMRKDSVFNFFVNGQFQTAIRLSDHNGAMHSDHRIYLPMKAFQPGLNKVELVPEMVPFFSNLCEILQDQNLWFTLFDDSDFVFPKAMRKARLPSLGLFSQTSYPYSAPPDGSDTAVFVTGREPETVRAAWTLMGKMAQISGALLHATEIGFKASSSNKKSLLVIGPRDQVPDGIVAKAPVSPLQVGKMRYVVSTSPKPEKLAASPVEEFLERVRGVPAGRVEPEPPSTVSLTMASDLVEDTVAVQYESPYARGYPLTLFTANDSTRLLAGMNALQDRRIWDNLAGDLAVWNSDPKSLALSKVGPDFIYQTSSVVTRVTANLDSRPWLFAILLLIVLVLIGLTVRAILKRRETSAASDSTE